MTRPAANPENDESGRAQKSDIEDDENVHGVALFSLAKNYFRITRGVPGGGKQMSTETGAAPAHRRKVQESAFNRRNQYSPNQWGHLEQFQVPCQLFINNKLSLSPNATKMLMFLYLRGKGRYKQLQRYATPSGDQNISTVASQEEISLKTGCARNTLTSVSKELATCGWIEAPAQRRAKRGELATNEYFLLHPKTGQRLENLPIRPYFVVPACIIRKEKMHWSLRSMKRSDVALYVAMLFRANQVRKNTFPNNHALLLKMSKLGRGKKGTYSQAIESLQSKGLITVDEESVTLCDPMTGEPIVAVVEAVNDPANYYDSITGKRITFNIENPEALLRWVRDSLPNGEDVIPENHDEYKIRCPYHPDPDPSLNFNPGKNTFHCFGCGASGTIRKLVKELSGTSESESIQQQARVLGYQPAFEPNSDAEAEYRYTDRDGEMLYRVLRLPGKQFSQQQWTPEGWVHHLKGVKKTLYNLPEIDCAATIIITEGEKDAGRVNQLGLTDFTGRRVVATTSGGADSWQDKFADLLTGPCFRIPAHLPMVDKRRVVVMPDSDEPGQRYKERILQSLDERMIPYCVVSFDGFKDVSDYLDAGHTGAELAQRIADELSKIGAGAVTFAESVPEQLGEITI